MDEAYFLYAGWLWYWIGSVGYFLADCLSGFVPDWLYFVLALVFVLDALLYLMAWRASESPKIDVWFWSEIVNVFASLFTAVAAGLYLVDFPKESALASQTFLMLQSGLYFTGTTLFFLNAVMCFSMFRRSRSIPLVRDPAFCAELFNLVPGAGYWGTRFTLFFFSLSFLVSKIASQCASTCCACSIGDAP